MVWQLPGVSEQEAANNSCLQLPVPHSELLEIQGLLFLGFLFFSFDFTASAKYKGCLPRGCQSEKLPPVQTCSQTQTLAAAVLISSFNGDGN